MQSRLSCNPWIGGGGGTLFYRFTNLDLPLACAEAGCSACLEIIMAGLRFRDNFVVLTTWLGCVNTELRGYPLQEIIVIQIMRVLYHLKTPDPNIYAFVSKNLVFDWVGRRETSILSPLLLVVFGGC